MTWHVLTSNRFDFDHLASESAADRAPSHLVPQIAERLGGVVHQPDPDSVRLIDRIAGRLYGQPQHWAMARRLLRTVRSGDSVFTVGCDAGVPLALLCGLLRRRVTFAITFVEPGRPKTRVMGQLLTRLLDRFLIFVLTPYQARRAEATFGSRAESINIIGGTIDCTFFRPGEHRAANNPPLLVSCGMEQRDYATMAAAVAEVDLDGRICLASPAKSDRTVFTMPDPIPDHLDFRHFEFDELRDLYQQADVVVVPLLANEYSAGLTTLFESMACGAPVVVSRSPGVIDQLADEGAVVGVEPGDVEGMKRAVTDLLADPDRAAALGDQARTTIVDGFSDEQYLEWLAGILLAPAPATIDLTTPTSTPHPPVRAQ